MPSFGHGTSIGSIGALPGATVSTSAPHSSAETAQKRVRRARIGLLAADGKDNKEIAAVLGTSPVTVGLWRQRILDMEFAGLQQRAEPN